jgi:hypothetical protein
MPNFGTMSIFYGYKSSSVGLFRIDLYYNNGYQMRVGSPDDNLLWRWGTYTRISDGPHLLEID